MRDEGHCFGGVAGKDIGGEALDVFVNRAAFLNRVHDRAKIIIHQNHGRGFFGNVGA